MTVPGLKLIWPMEASPLKAYNASTLSSFFAVPGLGGSAGLAGTGGFSAAAAGAAAAAAGFSDPGGTAAATNGLGGAEGLGAAAGTAAPGGGLGDADFATEAGLGIAGAVAGDLTERGTAGLLAANPLDPLGEVGAGADCDERGAVGEEDVDAESVRLRDALTPADEDEEADDDDDPEISSALARTLARAEATETV